MTQTDLARDAGTTQSVVSAIEAGRRTVSRAMLDRLLRSAKLRPSVPLERYADRVVRAADERGIERVRVFGSVVRGTDDERSDVDLLVDLGPRATYLTLLSFVAAAEGIIGFGVDVVTDEEVRDLPDVGRVAVPL